MIVRRFALALGAIHAVRHPGGQNGTSGGQRKFAPVLARAAVSLGIAALFLETHQDPDNAPSDGANMIPFVDMNDLINTLVRFTRLTKANPIEI